nr:MAG TPA: hypothetical protein [Caudoviricetes sp.]
MSTSSVGMRQMQLLRQGIALNTLIQMHLSYYKILQSNLILTKDWLSLRLRRLQRRRRCLLT